MAALAANEKIPMKTIVKSLSKIYPVNGRLEKVGYIKNNSLVILDYAHTPEALKICLQNIKYQFKYSKISLVFGCGGERDKTKRYIMGKIANDLCNKIYLTDDNPRKENPKKIRSQIKKNIDKRKLFETSSRAIAIKTAIKNLNSGDILIVAGKGHENYQEYFFKKSFSDKECILKNIKLKNKTLYIDWKKNIIKEYIKKIKFQNIKKINNASINSKELKKNDIFFGIKGKKFDGNKFANEAIKNGAIYSIVDKNFGKKKLNKIKVKNSLKCLSNLSQRTKEVSNIETIAITGSAGKTSLKELLGQSLNKLVSTCYSKNSFNNRYGLPLTMFNISKKNVFGVFEVGMDKKGEIFSLTKLLKPDMGVITNISYAHIKNFKSLSEIASAKSEIIDNINEGGKIVLNKDDKYFEFFKKKALKKKLKIISFSKKKEADVKYIKVKKRKNNFLLYLKIKKIKKAFLIKENILPFLENLMASVAIISNYFDLGKIKKNIFNDFKIPRSRGNFSKIKFKNKLINIIDESYNSNPLSLKFAINKFDKININSKSKKILLGDMLELGKFTKKLHNDAAKFINRSKINKVFVYGKYIRETYNKIKPQKKGSILKDKKEILNLIKNILKNNDYLMVKGSNATGLNSIFNKLKKGNFDAI